MNNRPIIVRPNPVIVRFSVRGIQRESSDNRQMDAPNRQIPLPARRTANRNGNPATGRNNQSAAHPLYAVRVNLLFHYMSPVVASR
ncbi:MAG: hypothetical protein ABSE48_22080 [Verrucomicrobiota bacterium]|jgi:hypothetical protein